MARDSPARLIQIGRFKPAPTRENRVCTHVQIASYCVDDRRYPPIQAALEFVPWIGEKIDANSYRPDGEAQAAIDLEKRGQIYFSHIREAADGCGGMEEKKGLSLHSQSFSQTDFSTPA
jgi:hypothetical protein